MSTIDRQISRRGLLEQATCGIGTLALAGLCQQARADYSSPLLPKTAHHPQRAKRLIFLHMRGGPAHMDTFDYKPELDRRSGQTGKKGKRKLVGSKWRWQQRGESGLWVSDLLKHQARHADKLCVISGMHTDIANHTPAMLFLHTGSFTFARPSLGSWLLYGLGTDNQDLPGFVSICPPLINGGTSNYGTAFLPSVFQGTAIGDIKTPVKNARIGNIANPRIGTSLQRDQLNLLQSLNRDLALRNPRDSRIDGVIESYELAFRMQSELPRVMDLSAETKATQQMYGIGEGKPSDNFGRQCLMARRLIEAGVRHVEVCDEFWDQHGKLEQGHQARAAATDQGCAALLADLDQRGLLEDTLVLWGGEFGRTPDTGRKDLDGRDHNPDGYSMWLAGGGVKGGFQYGATDELGYRSVEGRLHLHDLHATILHLMGLDHTRLTFRYGGRDFRLTDVHGRVVHEIIS